MVIEETIAVHASKRFTLADQLEFAALSGDWNPLHVDPSAARRTMLGAPVVHGVHILLWALESMLALWANREILELRAAFRRPLYLDRELIVTRDAASPLRLIASTGGELNLELDLTLGSGERPALPSPAAGAWPSRSDPTELAAEDLAGSAGAVPLMLDEARARAHFPGLFAALGAAPLADLLATTRLVGMYCPGLHSLFSGLKLRRIASPVPASELTWRAERVNPRYSSVALAVRGAAFEGGLDTFLRPMPRQPVSMQKLAAQIARDEFAAQRALVIGGSRGLGEAFAKAIAAGGGEVWLTYHRGREEAERVCAEIAGCGGRAQALAFDVNAAQPPGEGWPEALRPTHLYYFATPFIRIDRSKPFDAGEFRNFLDYYVFGLYAAIEAARLRAGAELVVYAPSTVFLDTPERGTAAYCAAKAAMEELARQLSTALPSLRVVTPRLPKIATDQTASLVAGSARDPAAVAIEQLRALMRA